jgi:predicted TPR repeat methyltransferase
MKLTKYDSNLAIYNDQAVVRHYTEVRTLEPCEKYIFEKNVFFFDAILDIGVGGGRTTPFLSARACHYVGIDYSEAMIKGAGSDFHHWSLNGPTPPI